MKYNIILADPPWSYNHKSLNRGGAERHYSTMDIEDIKKMPIPSLAAEDAVLFMWATFPLLGEGLELMKAWGFEYKTVAFVWVKTNKNTDVNQISFLPVDNLEAFWGMGSWTRANAEIILLGTKGKPKRQSASVHQIIYEPISKHSKKPDIVRDKIIQLCGDLPRVELFARNQTAGWDVFGNQVENSIDLLEAS